MKIERVWAREILDSRGNPTVEAEITVEGHRFTAIAPSGTSTGTWEAHELRDEEPRYRGRGVLKAVNNVRTTISKGLVGMDVTDQIGIDRAMIELDGTSNKSNLGGNAMIATSLAVAKAGAAMSGKHLYEYIGKDNMTLPVPMFNIINGGKHAGGNLRVQECMIIPVGAKSFSECLLMSVEVYKALNVILKHDYGSSAINVGDEGGFAPPLKFVPEAFDVMSKAITNAGYTESDIVLGMDAASSEFFKGRVYEIDGMELDSTRLIAYYKDLAGRYPLYSIEDPFFEDDFESTAILTKEIGKKVQIVGDDLFVTNTERLEKGINMGCANALLLKVNQIGTVSEANSAAEMSFKNGYNVVVSHRSGESEDVSIADLSVGWGSGEIKTGAPARGERTAKYNQLLRIEEYLGDKARFPGWDIFKK